jgi:hypothetical protein
MKFVLTGLMVLIASSAQATEVRLQVNSATSLDALRESQDIQVTTGRSGDVFTVDASAVLDIIPSRFEAVAMDFDLQSSLGMPETPESHTVDHHGDEIVAWIHMAAIGANSKHYFDLHVLHNGVAPAYAWAASWQMVRAQPGWPYEDAPAFGKIEGSLYVLPLGSAGPDTRQPTYVRYFSLAQVQTILPAWLISGFVRGQLASDIQRGLRILEAQAQ